VETEVPFGRSLVVYSDLRITPGEYHRPALGERGEQGVIVLEGVSGMTLDLDGVVLRGAPPGGSPDRACGLGLVIRSCEELLVRGGRLSGYRIPVLVESSRDVRLEGLEVEGGFAERLASTPAGPDPADWLETGGEAVDWAARYGGGIVLVDSSRVEVESCRVRRAQNGLLAIRCEGGEFTGNDFSYLSGWGIALTASQGCVISGNACDHVARGYVHDRYAEDFGAAGILLGPESGGNEIIGNRATHCSRGGSERGASRNLQERNRWIGNDFSFAAVAGLDLTDSVGGWVVENRFADSPGGGLRARGARDLVIHGNRFESILGAGLSIAEGTECVVSENAFAECDRGLELVSEPFAESGEGSGGHWTGRNTFRDNLQDLVLENSRELCFWGNAFQRADGAVHLVGLAGSGAEDGADSEIWGWLRDAEGHLPSGRVLDCQLSTPAPLDRSILEGVRSWLRERPHGGVPEGTSGREGLASLVLGAHYPWDRADDSAVPGLESFGGVLAGARWSAAWFHWGRDHGPRGDLDLWRSLRFEPASRGAVRAWCDPWGGSNGVRAEVGDESFGVIASAEFQVPVAGEYELKVLSDDGVRIRVDGDVVLEDWTWHSARREAVTIELEGGSHIVELEYFQIDGAAVLSVELSSSTVP